MTGAEQYARWVLDPANERETGRLIKLAAQRFMDDLKRDDIYFDEVEAVKMLAFGENHCLQWEGEWRGKPVRWELWQRFIYEQMYGWFRVDDGLRRFEEIYVQVAKKNGKSTMCAVDINYHIFADDRVQTPKVFTAANNEEQAKICVNMAGKIIQHSPDLSEYVDSGVIQLPRYGKDIIGIIHHERDGFVKAFSKESQDKNSKTSGGKQGVNASKGLVDEFGMSPDLGSSEDIYSSMASRSEPSMMYITTAGFNLSGPCYLEKRAIGIKVLEGVIKKDNYLPMIFEIDPPESGRITVDWLLANEWVWKHSNPNIDVSVKRKFLRSQLEDAKIKGGTKEVSALTLNFNIWMDSPDVFISSDIWNTNAHGLSPDDLDGQSCYAGIEIGLSGEISAVAFLFPGDIVQIKMMYFMAEEALKKNEIYLKNQDLIKADPGNVVDNEIAINWILEEFGKYNVHSFCFPNTQKENSIIQGLIKAGYTGESLSQGVNTISNPTDEWEKMIRSGKAEHFNDPLLAWMNSNCLAVRKETGVRITKAPNVYGIYACINAVAQWKAVGAGERDDAMIENW